MELVYLWIDKHKNIKNKGFNFNAKFACDYDISSNSLTINLKDTIVNIFPHNVNVNAIIGENGSGKTSIAEAILLSFFKAKVKTETQNWILLFNNQTNHFSIIHFGFYNVGFDQVYISDPKLNNVTFLNNKYYFTPSMKNFFNIHYNPSTELFSSFFLNHLHENSRQFDASAYDIDYKPLDTLNLLSFPSKKTRKLDIKNIENTYILNMFKVKRFVNEASFNTILGKVFNNSKIKFLPTSIIVSLDQELLESKLKKDSLRETVFKYQTDLSIKNLYIYFVMLIFSTTHEPINNKDEFTDYFFKEGKLKEYFKTIYNNILKDRDTGLASLSYAYVTMAKVLYDKIDDFIEESKNLKLSESLKNDSDKLDVDVHELARLIDILNEFPNVNLTKKISEISTIENILPVLPSFIKIDALDNEKRQFADFSAGEKNLIGFIYSLMYYINFYKRKDQIFNIVLDEVETGLNPKWQRNIFSSIINLLSCIDSDFILTILSHSPFVLSDLPKENILFVKKGEQCYPFGINEQTFGANIHTLLSHGFFLEEEGLIGEFAKSKITEVFNYLQNDIPLKTIHQMHIKSVINMIGEDFLKQNLLKIYNLKFPKSKEEKIKELQEELLRLQNDSN